MTNEELEAIEARQKAATPMGTYIVLDSNLIAKDVPKLIKEVRRLKGATQALEAMLGVSHRLAGCAIKPCSSCEENERAVNLAKKALEELRA